MFSNKSSWILVILSFGVLIALYFFTETKIIASTLLIGGLLITYFYFKRQQNISLHFVDIGLLIIIGMEFSSFLFSINPSKSYVLLSFKLLAILCFYLTKYILKEEKYISVLLHIGIYIILGTSIFSIYSFWILKNTLYSVEWFSFYDFRQLHRPFGLISNVWYSFLLFFLSYVLLYHYIYKKNMILCSITLISIVLNLIFSFSRSIYLILFLIIIISSIQYIVYKKNIHILICLIIPTLVGYCFLKEDFHKVLSFNSSISQQRSISARMESTENAINLLKNNYLGYGQGSYSLINSKRFEDVDIPFTSFAPNTLAQFFVENGILGTIVWLIFLFYLVFSLLRKMYLTKNKLLFSITLIFFCSFLIRELSFGVFLENLLYQILFYIFVALLIHFSNLTSDNQYNISLNKIFFYLALFIITTLSGGLFFKDKISIGENIQNGIVFWNNYKKNTLSKKSLLNKSNEYFKNTTQLNPFDIRIQFFHTMTEYEKGEKKKSTQKIDSLIKKYPKNSLYTFAMFSVLDKEKDKRAIDLLIRTIELSPKFVDTDFYKNFLEENPLTYYKLKQYFFDKYTNNISENPFELGKQGKILLYFGFDSEAKEKLLKASQLYPALSYIWLNLYHITKQEIYFKRFVLLEYGSYFVANINKYEKDFFNKKIDINFLQKSYIPKYQNWYMRDVDYFLIN